MFKEPKVTLIHTIPIEVVEIAARNAYDSFDKSVNESVKSFKDTKELKKENDFDTKFIRNLTHVNFHTAMAEFADMIFFIEGTSRGVLQELARHRIASYAVKSTRYTLSEVVKYLIWYIYNTLNGPNATKFMEYFPDMFVLSDDNTLRIVKYQNFITEFREILKSDPDMLSKVLSKEAIGNLNEDFEVFMKSKNKRNAGDPFKMLISDAFSTDVVMKINMRSFMNFYNLRNSGSAWEQIRVLAKKMEESLPKEYKELLLNEEIPNEFQ